MMSYEYFVCTFQFSHLSFATLRPVRKARKKNIKNEDTGEKRRDGDEELIPIRFV